VIHAAGWCLDGTGRPPHTIKEARKASMTDISPSDLDLPETQPLDITDLMLQIGRANALAPGPHG
jgi:hypothetical protein